MKPCTPLLLLLGLLAGAGATASASPDNPLATLKGADLQLLEEVRTIAGQVEQLRRQKFDRAPLAVRVSDDLRRAAAEIRAYSVLPGRRLEARGRAWADLGFGSEPSPQALLLTLASDLDGIGFDPQGVRLLVGLDRLTDEDFEPSDRPEDGSTVLLMTGVRPDEPLVVHQLMHVRQRERAGRDLLEPTTDRQLAAMAWYEGEANLVAIRHLFRGMGLAQEILHTDLDPGGVLDGGLIPRGIDRLSPVDAELVRFVYLEGFAKVVTLFLDGGWPALDAAAARRPTTRDLLHLDRPPLEPADFEPPAPPAPGMRLADEDSLGEQAIVVLVSVLTGKDNLGLVAGDGWAGDRLYRWEPEAAPAAAGVTVWDTRWTSDEAAADFEYAFLRGLKARFPGRPPEPLGAGRARLVAGGREFLVERDNAGVRVRIGPVTE